MKAAYIETTGDPEVIQFGDLPTPVPNSKEVLVKVGAVAVNPIDTYIRSGMVALPIEMPYVVGSDFAGTVEAVGSEVSRFKPGDRVWGSNQGFPPRQGSFAEFVCTRAEWIYPTPDDVSDTDAAATSLVGITAHLGLFRWAKLSAGDVVFVNGGTGGVGSMVVQMSRAAGASVIATVGSKEKAEICQRWGADLVLNYKIDDVDSGLMEFTKGEGVHLWFETQRDPDFVRAVPLIRPRGRMVVMAGREARPALPVGPFYIKDLTLFGYSMINATPDEQQACARNINDWRKEGKLEILIGKSFPLSEAAAAHRLQEDNTIGKKGSLRGKIVLTI